MTSFQHFRRPQQRWLDAAERRAAAKAKFHALPQTERDAIWTRLDRLLFTEAKWTVARTMPDNPHSYTRKRDWNDPRDFEWVVLFIRSGVADREKFPPEPGGRWYDVLHRCHPVTQVPCKIWPMNWPLSMTILLNRKPVLPGDR
jgi:hypothetical protein